MSDEDKPVVPAEPTAEATAEPAPAVVPPVTEAPPERVAEEPARPADPPPPRRGGAGAFVAALLGGALACAGGFAASHYNLLHLRTEPDLAAWDARLAALDKATAETGAALARVQAEAGAAPDLSPLTARIDRLEAAIDSAVKASDGGVTPAALSALQAEVEALKSGGDVRAVVQEEMARWQETVTRDATAEADAARTAALKTTALTTLHEAVVSGAPYVGALQALELADPPEALAKHAATGLPTIAALADSFPEAARAALAAAPATGAGFWGFVQTQVGARSLTPQEGTTPDAILSRAEAAVKAGDLARALEELAALPPESQAALADWTASARDRMAAEQALSTLPSATP